MTPHKEAGTGEVAGIQNTTDSANSNIEQPVNPAHLKDLIDTREQAINDVFKRALERNRLNKDERDCIIKAQHLINNFMSEC